MSHQNSSLASPLNSVTKLLPSNYLTWKLQVEALLDGYDLLKYPHGSFPAPSMTVSQTTTSHDLWTLLQRTYAKASRSHLKQLKERLHTVSKDMTDHVLCGLDDGYRAVIDDVNARDTTILFYDLLEKLLLQELFVVAAQQQVPSPMTTLNAQARPNHYDKTRSGQFFASSTSRPGNRKPFLGRCQWCNVKGHSDLALHHHVTNDLANLALHHPYTGPDSLFMGNDSGQTTHNGSCVDELYLWPAKSSSVHSVRTNSSASWHHRLGHPSSSIFTFIQQHFSLGSNKFQQSDCNSC
ncbi:hypothetical protein V8G54_001404 [Vigna mungo]|uniref:GAG-pre-integrase domain-containing protein n=1 Tax=Vigna mungo TaxID=3915 RepID=A0AAQ3P726_VIGMU